MAVFKNKIILEILEHYKTLWALSYTSAVNHWDLETYMPEAGAAARGEALAKLSSLRQKIFLENRFIALIHRASEEKNLTPEEKGVVRILLHTLRFYEKLPPSFLEEFEKLTNQATVVWRKAKETDDYKIFEPFLKRIFEMNLTMAEKLGFKDSPYDALLDLFEEGLLSSEVENFFDLIRNPLKNITKSIIASKNYNNSDYLDKMKYDKAKMEQLNKKILKKFFPEFGRRLRLDISSHPFTTSFSRNDTRITTWYQPKSFAESLLATIHEFGHALYDLQSSEQLEMSPIAGGSSLIIHESQSRFWENFIGRNQFFIESIIEDLQKVTGNKKLKVDEVYRHFNAVAPSLNRVESDEVTYHFHIMLRFEIEKGLMESKFKFKEIREVWASKMRDYLGIEPKNDREGVLQDVHWSNGMVGYFPTYSLGTFLGAQWEDAIQKELKGKNIIDNLPVVPVWLEKHIHKYGSTYTLKELLELNKMKYNPEINLLYLRSKYGKIYGF